MRLDLAPEPIEDDQEEQARDDHEEGPRFDAWTEGEDEAAQRREALSQTVAVGDKDVGRLGHVGLRLVIVIIPSSVIVILLLSAKIRLPASLVVVLTLGQDIRHPHFLGQKRHQERQWRPLTPPEEVDARPKDRVDHHGNGDGGHEQVGDEGDALDRKGADDDAAEGPLPPAIQQGQHDGHDADAQEDGGEARTGLLYPREGLDEVGRAAPVRDGDEGRVDEPHGGRRAAEVGVDGQDRLGVVIKEGVVRRCRRRGHRRLAGDGRAGAGCRRRGAGEDPSGFDGGRQRLDPGGVLLLLEGHLFVGRPALFRFVLAGFLLVLILILSAKVGHKLGVGGPSSRLAHTFDDLRNRRLRVTTTCTTGS